MELVGPSRRFLSTSTAGVFFSIGDIILGGLAYWIRDYRHLQLAISLPAIIFIAYYWYLKYIDNILHQLTIYYYHKTQ